MNTPTADSNFEKFRRERRQRRAQFGSQPVTAPTTKSNGVTDVEAYEARQMHETKLTRDVHDFLAEATKQAATIVEKVTQVAEAETAQRLAREMREFLEETMRRAARFMEMVHSKRGQAVMQDLEPHVSNLVGASLDEFRFEGTAQLADKHIGQDPFFEEVDQAQDGDDGEDATVDEIDLDAVDELPPPPPPPPRAAPEPAPRTPQAAREPAPRTLSTSAQPAPAVAARPEPAPEPAPVAAEPESQAGALGGVLSARMFKDRETLKNALKALVRSGVLTPDDARETYRNALQQPES